jgi:hypothetical protein
MPDRRQADVENRISVDTFMGQVQFLFDAVINTEEG